MLSVEEDPVSIRGKKLVKVSALLSYLDIPLPVPIQILCRLSSLNEWIYSEFMDPLLCGSGKYLLNIAPSKRRSSPPVLELPIHRKPFESLIIVCIQYSDKPSCTVQLTTRY